MTTAGAGSPSTDPTGIPPVADGADDAEGHVIVEFRFRGGDYRLAVDPATAQRLAAAEGSFPTETRGRLRDHLRPRRERTA